MAHYTNLLKDWLIDYESSTEWQNVVTRFNHIENFVDVNGNETITFYNMFKNKYLLREICCETNEQFIHYISQAMDEVFIKYSNKIKQAYDIIKSNDEWQESDVLYQSEGGNNDNTQYLNPITSTSSKIQGHNKQEYTASKNNILTKNRKRVYTPEEKQRILEKFNTYYNDALNIFETCFMGIY